MSDLGERLRPLMMLSNSMMTANTTTTQSVSNSNTTPSPYHYAIAILLELYHTPTSSSSSMITSPPNLDPILHLLVPVCPPISDPFDPIYPQLLDSIRTRFAGAVPSSSALANQLDDRLKELVERGPASLVSSLTPLLDRLHSHSYLYSWLRNFLTRIHKCEFVVIDLHTALVQYLHPATTQPQVRFMSLETARAWVENATKTLQSSLAPTSTSSPPSAPPPPTSHTLSHIHAGTLHILACFPDQAPAHYLASLVATVDGRATHALDHLTRCEALTRSTADFAMAAPDALLGQKCWRALTRALVYLKLDWARTAHEYLYVALAEANFVMDSECAAVARAHLEYFHVNGMHEAEAAPAAAGLGALGNVSDAVARLGAGVFELHAVLVLVREALANRGPREALSVLDQHAHGIALVPADQRLVALERTHVALHEAFLACDWGTFDTVAGEYEERANGVSQERGAAKHLQRLALMRGHAAVRRRDEWRAVEWVDGLGEAMEAQCIRIMAYLSAEAWGPAFDLVAFRRPPPTTTTTTDPWSLLFSILEYLVRSRFRTDPSSPAQPPLADVDLSTTLAAIGRLAPNSWIRSLILGQLCMHYTPLADAGINKDGRFRHEDVCEMAWQSAKAVQDKYWMMYLCVDPACEAVLMRAGSFGPVDEVQRAREEAARVLVVERAVF